jgi:hypothetical protein
MKLHLESVEFWDIGRSATRRTEQWGTIAVWMKDREMGRNHLVEVKVVVPKRREVTFGEMQELARTQAIEVLRQAADALEGGSFHDLERAVEERWEERNEPIDSAYFNEKRDPAYRLDNEE